MRRWVLLPALMAPIALIGGWTVAAGRQPAGYSSTQDTISALAALDARDRWIMTVGIAILGCCYLAMAIGLPALALLGRRTLAVGGVATLLVAVFPLPLPAHGPIALTAFVAMSIWPALSNAPSRAVSVGATAVMLGLLAWFFQALQQHELAGLSERALAGCQSLWPAAVILYLMSRPTAAT